MGRRAGGGRGERREPGAESRGQKNKNLVTNIAGYIGRSLWRKGRPVPELESWDGHRERGMLTLPCNSWGAGRYWEKLAARYTLIC